MVTNIKKIGNSKGVVIPAPILRALGLHENDSLTIEFQDQWIKLTKQSEFDPKSIEELFNNYPETLKTEIVFDEAMGCEQW